MRDKVSQIVSHLFHPLLMPTLTFCLLFAFAPHLIQPISLMTLPFLFVTTFVIPMISISILKVSGSIKSLRMEDREERMVPFVFITLFFMMTTYLFIYKVGVNQIVGVIFLSTTLLLILLTLVTSRYKISIHAAALSGVCGYLLALCWRYPNGMLVYPLIVTLIVAGGVMSARLQLNAHRAHEVLAGSLLGLLTCFAALYWFI
ncbi:PA-phosphatase [Reichenbachiella sp. MSK19-1]|uniref:PA-phosphatase n=1 Tax=Reichenbachiella sp. MSK19-1 TaxID=1897631 RepID=UPI000E6B7E04|nr:PA-phosphatase [Reichenbachiella sp. MSK19-1]